MTATACILAALLSFEAASAPPANDACELTDDRCKAALYERRSVTAKAADHRARYLFNAHNLYLRLFDKTGDARDLCAAQRAIEASLAVDEQPEALRAESKALRTKLLARAKQQGARCASKRHVAPADARQVARGPAAAPAPADAPLMARAPVTEPTSATTNAGTPEPAATSTPASSELRLLVETDPVPHRDDGLMPVEPRQAPSTPTHSSVPRPGRGLVIASGVTLGVGVALGLSAGLINGRMTDTRQALYNLNMSVGDGYGTDAENATDDSLRADYTALTRQRAALALGAGTTLVVAIVLAAVGGRKLARSSSRAALLPAPGGLVLRGRF